MFGDEDHKIKLEKGDYYHQYDLWFRKKIPGSDEKTEIIVEVDGGYHKPENIAQQNRDKKAESFINFFFPDTYFIRVLKEEIVTKSGKQILFNSDVELYINKLLNKKYGLNKDLL